MIELEKKRQLTKRIKPNPLYRNDGETVCIYKPRLYLLANRHEGFLASNGLQNF